MTKKHFLQERRKRLQNLQARWRSEKAGEVQTTEAATNAVVTSSTRVESIPVESIPIESIPVESIPIESIPVESIPVESVPIVTTNGATSTVVGTDCSTATSSAISSSASLDPHTHAAMEEFVPLARSTPQKDYRKVASEFNYESILFEHSNSASEVHTQSAASIPSRPELQIPSTSGISPKRIQRKQVKKVLYFEDVEAMLSTSLDLSFFSSAEEDNDEEEIEAPLPQDVIMNHIETGIEPIVIGNEVFSKYNDDPMHEIIHSEIKREEEEDVHPIEQAVVEEGLHISEAAKRLKLMKGFSSTIIAENTNSNGNLFVELSQLNALLRQSIVCRKCDSNKISIKIKETKNRTFVNQISTYCSSCKYTLASKSSSSIHPLPQSYKSKFTHTNNLRFALGAISSGIGYEKANKFFSNLNLPPLSNAQYGRVVSDAVAVIENKLEDMKDHAAEVVRKYYKDNFGTEEENGAINITVSFDGTWMTRGHASKFGVCFVIESATGLILDVHVASQYCHICKVEKKRKNPVAFKEWYLQHKSSKQCQINYDPIKSSGGMEPEAATILFGRSMARKLRYSTIISDEDSSTFVTLTKANIYGNDYPIKKINCLNHISKKIYRKLDEARLKQRLGGVGDGKLTQASANAFANFYRIAVKQFVGNNDKIRRTVLGSIFHHASTDAKPMHHLCNTKFCKYKRDISLGQKITPTWHVDKANRAYTLNEKSSIAVFRVLGEMLQDNVLDLVSGQTQNINESVHSKLWNLVPKTSFRGYKCLLYSVAQTVLEHNCGMHEGHIYQNLGLSVGKELKIGASRSEKTRTKLIKVREGRGVKRKRKEAKKKSKDYGPGGF